MAPLLRGHLAGAGHRQVSSGPEPDIFRQGPACAGEKVRNALDTGKPHTVPGLLFVLVRYLRGGRIAGEKPLDHKLQKTVLRGQLGASSKRNLPDLVNRVSFLPHCAGEPHIDMVLPQPFQKADKPGVYAQNIRAYRILLPLKFKGGPPDRIGKHSVGVMLQLPRPVVQHQNGLLRRRLPAVGIKNLVGTFRFLRRFRRMVKIKNWHSGFSCPSVFPNYFSPVSN